MSRNYFGLVGFYHLNIDLRRWRTGLESLREVVVLLILFGHKRWQIFRHFLAFYRNIVINLFLILLQSLHVAKFGLGSRVLLSHIPVGPIVLRRQIFAL